jgi:hypothetical protein
MHMFDLLYYSSDLSGFDQATYDGIVLYYRYMAKVDWFGRWYVIFQGGVSHEGRYVLISNVGMIEEYAT